MDDEVLIIGSGPGGLACAAHLHARGVAATVVEKGAVVAAAWAGRYDSLRFNTNRWSSALPGTPFPRAWGQFPTRDQYVEYLRRYAERHHIDVRTGVEVLRLDPRGSQWSAATTEGPRWARHVIVATGLCNRPVLPQWAAGPPVGAPGLQHSVAYREPGAFTGQRVVVVGCGSTGLEIAHELVDGGAACVSLAYRTPPTVLLRTFAGLPTDLPVPLLLHLPAPVVDAMFGVLRRRMVGDLSPYGLPDPVEGPMASLRRGRGPPSWTATSSMRSGREPFGWCPRWSVCARAGWSWSTAGSCRPTR